jgi:branched-chain amino acid transport system ATP-binding protein
MLAIGRSLMSEPDYLLLDEPSLGLAPKLVDQIAELVLEINNLGVSVLLVEQNANMALNVSDHAYIMENGTIVMDKNSEELKKDEDVQEFYLGLSSNSSERKSFRDVKHYKRKKRWLS